MKRQDSLPNIKRHEMLTELVDVIIRALTDHDDIPPDLADAVANTAADYIADNWGGQVVTFPKDFLWRLSKRELAIHQDWRQSNRDLAAHARKYGFGERGMRRLLKRVQGKIDAQRHTAQLDMVDPEEK